MLNLVRQLFFVALLVCSGALGKELTLRRTEVELKPPAEQYQRWVDSYWDTEIETWAFSDERDALSFFRSEDVPADLSERLVECRTELTHEEAMRRGWQGNYRTRVFYSLPPEVRDRVPASLLQRYFTYHQSEIRSVNFPISAVETSEVSDALRRSIVQHLGRDYVIITPYSWKKLPIKNKLEFLEAKLRPHALRRGLEVWLVLGPDEDPHALARHISPSGLYADEIARKLQARQSKRETVEIPLVDLLPGDVAAWVNQYFDCPGPNCFGVAKAFSERRAFPEAIGTAQELVNWLDAAGFQGVESGTPLEMGDVLLYETGLGGVLHASVYLTDGLVVSRNGFSKTYPTVLQTKEAIERAYFDFPKFRTWVYRKAFKPKAMPYVPLYSAPAELEYIHLGLHPESSPAAHRRVLHSLFSRPLWHHQEQELRRYLFDERFVENREAARALLTYHREFASLAHVANRWGFFPTYPDVKANRAALRKLAGARALSPDEVALVNWIAKHWERPYRAELRQIYSAHFSETGTAGCGGILQSLRLRLALLGLRF